MKPLKENSPHLALSSSVFPNKSGKTGDFTKKHHANDESIIFAGFYHRPVIPLLLFLVAGIVLGRFIWPVWFAVVAWLIVVACMAILICSAVRQKAVAITPFVFFFTLGWLAVSSWMPPFFPPEKVLSYIDKKPREITGTVSQPPVKQGFRTRCVLRDIKVHRENENKPPLSLPGGIQLTVYGDAPKIPPGSRITINRKIRALRNFNNPGGFDYKQYMAYRDIWGTAWDSGSRIEVRSPQNGKSFFTGIANMRVAIDQAIASAAEGDNRAVLAALVIGKRDLISPQLRDIFNRAGVSHLLAISGLHVGIVATVSFFIIGGVLGRNTFLLRRAMVKKVSAVLSMIFVIGYGLIAGMSPSTQRAVIMICIFLFAYVFDRQYNPANTLAAAALGILAISPPSVFSISFQLSFAAVTAIFMGLYLWIPGGSKTADEPFKKKLYKIIAGFVWVSILAIIGTMPLVAYYFNQVSFLGIAANLLLVPLVGFIVVPVSLVSAVLYFFSEPVAFWGFAIADSFLTAALFIAEKISTLPYGAFTTVTPSIVELTAIYAILISLPLWLMYGKKQKKCPESEDGRNQDMQPARKTAFLMLPKTVCAAIAIIAALILLLDAAWWVNHRFFHTDLRVTYLDVGQGNAALVEIPGGKTMLIDGGGFSDNASFDVGALIVAPFLWRNKIQSIDKVVLSHPHSDHLNGLLYILKHFSPGKIISTQYPADTTGYARFVEIIENRGILHPPFSDLSPSKNINGVDIDVYYPPQSQTPENAPANLNNGSIVLKITYNDTSFLFPGDIESGAEAELVELAGKDLDSTFMLSPHHGSKTSSTPGFLDAVSPETVIISARQDRFDFPSEEVLKRYLQAGYAVFKTQLHGAVRVIVDKNGSVVIKPTTGEQNSKSKTGRGS